MDRYISKVINRDQLEKSIILHKLKGVNLGINSEDPDFNTIDFNIKKYKFDCNNETIITIEREYIEYYTGAWKQIKKYNGYTLCNIYGTADYLLIDNDILRLLPDISTSMDSYQNGVYWCAYDCWKLLKKGYDDEQVFESICEPHADRMNKSPWVYSTDSEELYFYALDRFEIFENSFKGLKRYLFRTTLTQEMAFRKFFEPA